jgi:hypothetical protein
MKINLDHRITAQVPESFADAVHRAASERGLTVADYARQALSEKMKRHRVDHPRLPPLSSPPRVRSNG